MPFDEYDKNKLIEAKKLLVKVYEFNYGSPRMHKEVNRLETIINKLDFLLKEEK